MKRVGQLVALILTMAIVAPRLLAGLCCAQQCQHRTSDSTSAHCSMHHHEQPTEHFEAVPVKSCCHRIGDIPNPKRRVRRAQSNNFTAQPDTSGESRIVIEVREVCPTASSTTPGQAGCTQSILSVYRI